MTSHKIRTGLWAKKKFHHKDLFRFIHEMTPAQLSFCRHIAKQALGGKGSKLWAHHDFQIEMPHSKEDLQFFLKASEHPKHIFSEKMAEHKSAAGILSTIGKAVVSGGKAVGRGALAAGKFMAAHSESIMKGLGTALQLGTAGVQLAAQVGLLDPEQDSTLINLANASQMLQDSYAEANQPKESEKKKEKEKPAGSFDEDRKQQKPERLFRPRYRPARIHRM